MSDPCVSSMDASQLAYPLFDPVNYSPADSSPFSVAFNFDNQCTWGNWGGCHVGLEDSTGTEVGHYDCTDDEMSGGYVDFVFVAADGSSQIPRKSLSTTGKYTLTFTTTGARAVNRFASFAVTHNTVAGPEASAGLVRKRHQRVMNCPSGYRACPSQAGFECINTASSLYTCGGCPNRDGTSNHDCGDIPNVAGVSCMQSTCLVTSCAKGYTVSEDLKSCVASLA